MQPLVLVTRKLTLLATMVVMPGGLLALVAIGCMLVFLRTRRGRIAFDAWKLRIPPRIKAPLRRLMVLARGEDLFRSGPRQLPST